MRSNDFVSVDEVIAEAAEYLNDADFSHGAGRSFYEVVAHRAVERLAINTFFAKITKDVFDWNACGEGIYELPKNMFNIKEIYLFNSSCDADRDVEEDNCNCQSSCCQNKGCWTNFVEAHLKRRFNRFGSSGIKTAKIAPNHNDPVNGLTFYENANNKNTPYSGTLVYFGIQNGSICISDSGFAYKNMRIVSNTFGSDNCKLPIIPRELRAACVDKVTVDVCKKIMLVYDEYRPLYQTYYTSLYGDGSWINAGTWVEAERFVKKMDSKQRNDLFDYFADPELK